MTDYTRLLGRLDPRPDGESPVRHRSGVVTAVNTDGTLDIDVSGTSVPSVSALTPALVGEVVQILAWKGDLIVLGVIGAPAGGGPIQVIESTSQNGITSTTFVPGLPACGTAFVVPASGEVWIDVYGFLAVLPSASGGQRRLSLGWELREGGTVGSGTVVVAAADVTRVVSLATSIDGNAAQSSQADRFLVTGLVSGDTYNVRTMHKVNNGTAVNAIILERRITVEPVF